MMRLTVRGKIVTIATVATVAFVLLIGAGSVIAGHVEQQLTTIRDRLLPKLELGPQLESQLDRLQRGFQDAVGARDNDLLGATAVTHHDFLARLDGARGALDERESRALRLAFESYYADAYQVSKRMIDGETGEAVVEAINRMQLKQAVTKDLLHRTTAVDRHEITAAFAAAQRAQQAAASFQMAIAVGCLSLVILLSVGLSRAVLRAISQLSVGFQRFGEGDFSRPVPSEAQDELGDLARAANRMADNLERLGKERKEAEDRLKRTNEELERAQETVLQATKMKSEFLANMSHELRTPLNAILGFGELIHAGKVGPVSDDQKEYLGDILTSARHLLQLINDILDLAKVESGKMEFHAQEVDLASIVGEARDILRGLAAEKRITLDIDIDPSLGRVTVDPSRLKQVLYNYLSNAIKFTPARGKIVVRIRKEGGRFRVDVQDSGIGIRPEDIHRLFGEFQQINPAAQQHRGTGLGLALTKRIVEGQGGAVEVHSTPGQGSTFSAILPCAAK